MASRHITSAPLLTPRGTVSAVSSRAQKGSAPFVLAARPLSQSFQANRPNRLHSDSPESLIDRTLQHLEATRPALKDARASRAKLGPSAAAGPTPKPTAAPAARPSEHHLPTTVEQALSAIGAPAASPPITGVERALSSLGLEEAAAAPAAAPAPAPAICVPCPAEAPARVAADQQGWRSAEEEHESSKRSYREWVVAHTGREDVRVGTTDADVVEGLWTCCRNVDPNAPGCIRGDHCLGDSPTDSAPCNQCGSWVPLGRWQYETCVYHPGDMSSSRWGASWRPDMAS